MDRKEIYASLEIGDHEVRLIVGEFYDTDTRFHVLHVERARISGIEINGKFNDKDIIKAIQQVVSKASQSLGYEIKRILLAIPSKNVHRFSQRVRVIPEDMNKKIHISDIQKGLNQAILYKPDGELELVNIGCIKYISNGITSRKMPINEVSELLLMDVDLLYADRKIMYSFASCVEKAGLHIMDLCLDAYAIAQEAAVCEQTVDKYVIQICVERDHTTLSLFTHGRLASSKYIEYGYGEWLKPLGEKYRFSDHVCYRLAQNTCEFDVVKASDQIIYVWSESKKQKQITEKEVAEMIQGPICDWIDMINESCEPILESGEASYLITGTGCEIQSVSQLLNRLNSTWQIYVPGTIGARDASLTACLGMFYSWKEQQTIRKDERICADLEDVEITLSMEKPKTHEEGGFTRRLKNILQIDK